MTLMDIMERLVEENIPFEFNTDFGYQSIYVYGEEKPNGYIPHIRISIEDGQLYRRNCGIVGFVPIDVLLKEIRGLM